MRRIILVEELDWSEMLFGIVFLSAALLHTRKTPFTLTLLKQSFFPPLVFEVIKHMTYWTQVYAL